MLRIQKKSSDQFGNFSIFQLSLCRYFVSGPSTSKRSYYEILGVSNKASPAEIKNAFLALTKKYHPDVNKDDKNAHERFVEISEAYEVLSKAESRQSYDVKLAYERRPAGDNGDFATQRPSRPVDPVDEMYRRHFGEIYRRRYPTDFRQKQYGGQRQDNPFRDIFRDRPVGPERNSQNGAEDDPWRPRVKVRPTVALRVFRLWFALIFVTAVIQVFANAIYEDLTHKKPYREYDDIDRRRKLEERWRKSIIFDHEEKPPVVETPTKKPDDQNES